MDDSNGSEPQHAGREAGAAPRNWQPAVDIAATGPSLTATLERMPDQLRVLPVTLSGCGSSVAALADRIGPVTTSLRRLANTADHTLTTARTGPALAQLARSWAPVADALADMAQSVGVAVRAAASDYQQLDADLAHLTGPN